MIIDELTPCDEAISFPNSEFIGVSEYKYFGNQWLNNWQFADARASFVTQPSTPITMNIQLLRSTYKAHKDDNSLNILRFVFFQIFHCLTVSISRLNLSFRPRQSNLIALLESLSEGSGLILYESTHTTTRILLPSRTIRPSLYNRLKSARELDLLSSPCQIKAPQMQSSEKT